MAAIVVAPKTAEVAAPKANKPTNIVFNPAYQLKDKAGKPKGEPFPTLAVGPLESEVNGGFAGNLEKWKRVMGLDKDGDAVIGEVFKVLHMTAKDEAEKEALIDNMNKAVESITAYLNSLTAE